MANPRYFPEPEDLTGNLAHTIEECSEVQKECCKIIRFGPVFSVNATHLDFVRQLREEILDAQGAMTRLLKCLELNNL